MTASLLLGVLLLLPTQKELPKFDGPVGPPADKFTPDPSWKALDKTNSLFFDPKDRSLILRARVCLREGYLEHLLCSEQTKEHESILATKATPKAHWPPIPKAARKRNTASCQGAVTMAPRPEKME